MVDMKKLNTLLFLLFAHFSFGQIPIGQDLKEGTSNCKKIFANCGQVLKKEEKLILFEFNKKTQKHDIPTDEGIQLLYKEEFRVSIYKNEYDNIGRIAVYTKSLKVFKNIQNCLDYEKWTLQKENKLEKEKFYSYNDLRIRVIENESDHTFQIIIERQ